MYHPKVTNNFGSGRVVFGLSTSKFAAPMASTVVKSSKLKRVESKKSHSWWWDSHNTPKNKLLQENLEEMDQHVKRMLKLIEEDADSFAKKAELYFKARPELISLVEQFYRMYRSLAERYDIATGELKKHTPLDLQSLGSGVSEGSSGPPSSMASPDRRRPDSSKSGPRAAGFDVFLKSGGSGSDLNSKNSVNKEGDESSSLDSDSESDDSTVNNYSGTQSTDDEQQGLQKKIIELEAELLKVKESYEDLKKSNYETTEVYAKITTYEEELRVANEKIQSSDEEIARLTNELQKYYNNNFAEDSSNSIQESVIGAEVMESAREIETLEEELRITKEKLHDSEEEVTNLRQSLQDGLTSAQNEASTLTNKLEKEKREVGKLLERVTRYKTNLTDRDQEIRALKEAVSNANKSLSEENERLKSEMTTLSKERAYLEDKIKELDLNRQSLEDEVRQVKGGKDQMEGILRAQIEQLKADILERDYNVEELMKKIDALNSKIADLESEISSKDKEMSSMSNHLHELHVQHVELITRAEVAGKRVEELGSRVKELEMEVEKKEEIILQGGEEKREAIRQLCFSLEHYRDGYHRLREAVSVYKGHTVMAS